MRRWLVALAAGAARVQAVSLEAIELYDIRESPLEPGLCPEGLVQDGVVRVPSEDFVPWLGFKAATSGTGGAGLVFEVTMVDVEGTEFAASRGEGSAPYVYPGDTERDGFLRFLTYAEAQKPVPVVGDYTVKATLSGSMGKQVLEVVFAVVVDSSVDAPSCDFAPSPAPSDVSTIAPTEAPVLVPTPVPSDMPTAAPSAPPTQMPFPKPTLSPTASPAPSGVPTAPPTASPTTTPAPSLFPTPVPTPFPSGLPTSMPSSTPSSAPSLVPSSLPTPRPTFAPTVSVPPTFEPTEGPTATFAPTAEPTEPASLTWKEQNPGKIAKAYLIQDNDPSKLVLEKHHHHLILEDGKKVDDVIWFHGQEEYNIAVEVSPGVAWLEMEGYFYRFGNFKNEFLTTTNEDEQLNIPEKWFENPSPSEYYLLLDGSEDRSQTFETPISADRLAPGKILLQAGKHFLTIKTFDENLEQLDKKNLELDIYANAQRDPVFPGYTLEASVFKNIGKWQDSLPVDDPNFVKADGRPGSNSLRISHVQFFKDYLYICHEIWATVFKVQIDDDASDTSGLSLFLDVHTALGDMKKEIGRSNKMHGGLRAVALHPFGSTDEGRVYVSLMESTPKNKVKKEYKAQGLYLPLAFDTEPFGDESVLCEFQYQNGVGDPDTYRILFRVEVPVFDHTIRQITFGVDDPKTKTIDEGALLYIAHGDGSVESARVGTAQVNDALGKILRIDPLDGTQDVLAKNLKDGEYATWFNPFPEGSSATPGVQVPLDDPNAPAFSAVPKETFALGFRNAHTLTFTEAGQLIIGEAGRDAWEEINVVEAGGNYAWSHREGDWKHKQNLDDELDGGMFYSSEPMTEADECADCNFIWPVLPIGHSGFEGMKYASIALAGGHVIEENNGSPVVSDGGKFFWCDFPYTGEVYYAYSGELLNSAKTIFGSVFDVDHPKIHKAKIKFDDTVYPDFRQVMLSEIGSAGRVDLRFGRDCRSTMYVSSKTTSMIYRIDNTIGSDSPLCS